MKSLVLFRLLDSIQKNGLAVTDEIACFVPDSAEKSGEGGAEGEAAVQKKLKVAQLQWSIKNEFIIRSKFCLFNLKRKRT